MKKSESEINKIFTELQATSLLVAILKHSGEVRLPSSIFDELITQDQVWPNDFITNHGSMMSMAYDEESDEIKFRIEYKEDNIHHTDGLVGFKCTRNQTDVGFVDYDSPFYRR